MQKTEGVALCGLAIVAAVCGGFGIYSFVELAEIVTPAIIIWALGIIVFCGISIGAIAIAWFGWKAKVIEKEDLARANTPLQNGTYLADKAVEPTFNLIGSGDTQRSR